VFSSSFVSIGVSINVSKSVSIDGVLPFPRHCHHCSFCLRWKHPGNTMKKVNSERRRVNTSHRRRRERRGRRLVESLAADTGDTSHRRGVKLRQRRCPEAFLLGIYRSILCTTCIFTDFDNTFQKREATNSMFEVSTLDESA